MWDERRIGKKGEKDMVRRHFVGDQLGGNGGIKDSRRLLIFDSKGGNNWVVPPSIKWVHSIKSAYSDRGKNGKKTGRRS